MRASYRVRRDPRCLHARADIFIAVCRIRSGCRVLCQDALRARERERERRAGGSSRGTSIRTPRLDRWIDRSNVAVGSGGAPAIFSPARRVRNDEFADGDYPHTRHWPIDTFSLSFSLFSLSMTSAWKTAAWTAKGKPRAEGRASVFSFYLSPAMDGKREFGRL